MRKRLVETHTGCRTPRIGHVAVLTERRSALTVD